MKFVYIGPDAEAPVKTKFMGQIDFVLNGDPVEVTDEHLIKKLVNNQCFKKVETPKPKPKAKAKAAPKAPISFE